jgi:phosphoribosylformylglycinamidine cyclo-ligase
MNIDSYEAAGVNVEMGDRFVDRIKSLTRREVTMRMAKAAGGYAAVYPLTPDRYVALTTDGVGTKVLLAHQFGKHHGIGIDLVAMCANDLICVGAKPILFLDYYATGRLDLSVGSSLIEGIVDGCQQAGMLLVGGETAEMPIMISPGLLWAKCLRKCC